MPEREQGRSKFEAAIVNEPPNSLIDLPTILGSNLKRLRTRQGYSLERLAERSGVSRAMISQIETAKSVPTISLLWKVAQALDVEFANLLVAQRASGTTVLRRDRAKIVEASMGKFSSRALFRQNDRPRAEFFELRIAPLHAEDAEPRAPGMHANVVVTRGNVAVSVRGSLVAKLGEGDALFFQADVAHSYRNLGDGEAVLYLVISCAVPIAC